uniref:Putative multidrug resistance protein n=1 Tax=Tanacetum cinerariifolium TaxID=118510 RepID=A0A699GW65_TANCI|nr:putative multidrug resistance protein [Tanacetum cinerariifolium]
MFYCRENWKDSRVRGLLDSATSMSATMTSINLSQFYHIFVNEATYTTKKRFRVSIMKRLQIVFAIVLVGFCWGRTAERQASWLRIKYLKTVSRQEIGFTKSEVKAIRTNIAISVAFIVFVQIAWIVVARSADWN